MSDDANAGVACIERVVCCSCHRERPKVECFHVYSVNNIYRCICCHSLMARLARLRGLPGSISELSRANLMIEAEGLYGAALKAKVEEVLVSAGDRLARRSLLENADRMTHPTRRQLKRKDEKVMTNEKRRRFETAEVDLLPKKKAKAKAKAKAFKTDVDAAERQVKMVGKRGATQLGEEVKICEKLQRKLKGVVLQEYIELLQAHAWNIMQLACIVEKGEGTEAEGMSFFKKCQETREASSIYIERLQAQIAAVQE